MSDTILFFWWVGVVFTIGAFDIDRMKKWWQTPIMIFFCIIAWSGILGEIAGRKLK